MEAQARQLNKSRTDRVIDGVCGGIAEYFGVDPTLVRVGAVLLALAGGIGILVYIVAMIVMPLGPHAQSAGDLGEKTPKNNSAGLVGGVVLVGLGLVFFLRNIGVFAWHSFFWFFSGFLFPLMLILVGVVLLILGKKRGSDEQNAKSEQATEPAPHQAPAEPVSASLRRMHRSRLDRKIFGVCGGFADYFGIDSTVVRILLVVSAFLSFGLTLLAYILLAILIPEEPLFFEAR